MRRVLALTSVLLISGCANLPLAGLGLGTGPVLLGQVSGATTSGWRVGLFGAAPAIELASATVNGGTFSLALPAVPGAAAMEQPAEVQSIVFTLRAYQDTNGNGRFDAGERQGTSIGSFRYFATDGPAGTYRAGWNQYRNGIYSQQFDAAFTVSAGA